MTAETVMMVVCAVSLALYAAMNISAQWKIHKRPLALCRLPPVSVLKPLCGLDDGLYENLRAIIEQDYPNFEVIFGAESADDPAIEVARRLQLYYSEKKISIIAGFSWTGLNPKVNNVMVLSHSAKNDLVLISDSNVRPDKGYLRAIVAEMSDKRVGLVSSLLVGRGEKTLGSALENLHLNTVVAGGVCGMHVVAGQSLAIGKSMLFRLSEFRSLGGFRAVKNILAEDFIIGKMYEKAGYRVALSTHLLPTFNQSWPVSRFLSRHVRWSQLRRRLFPVAYLFEPLSNPVPLLLAALALSFSGRPGDGDALRMTATGGLFIKVAMDITLAWRLRGERPTKWILLLIPAKDCIMTGVWLVAAFKSTVMWRGHPLRIGAGTVLRPMNPTPEDAVEQEATGEAA